MPGKRIAIIGAGPIGLEAALHARLHNFDVVVLEQQSISANVRSWGHVRLFSPFGINSSKRGRAALQQSDLPSNDAILTGAEFYAQYLLPLSQLPALKGCVRENARVVSIGKRRLWKGDSIGQPSRMESPFQILVESADGHEETFAADVVLDCSGTFGNHNWLGDGGIPAIGERKCAEWIDYCLSDIAGKDNARFVGKRVLVVGSGYSAATAIVAFRELIQLDSATEVIWLTRKAAATPLTAIDGDVLTERALLTATANALAKDPRTGVAWIAGASVREISVDHRDGLLVHIHTAGEQGGDKFQTLTVDRIIANVGYRPDRSLYEELQVHECYASQGPMKLAAALLVETSGDCMTQSSQGPDSLRNPEPGFYILGAKSYGRDSRFLLRVGLEQIESAFALIAAEAE
ncbi:MAG: FAD-dependent oxidoreductase [Planctomycetota bacterium]|nr:FAD-dependent oxidoreductase [Planctomycetota bacterium]MDA1162231.1 FAD-dependent oxidoreductase [Planctomycetota bacterium]